MKFGRDKFSFIAATLSAIDLLVGLVVLYRFWIAIQSRVVESEGVVLDVQIPTDGWTVTRPWLFALIFGAMFGGNKRKDKIGSVVVASSFLIGLLYYATRLTWFDVVVLYHDYQFPEFEKPFIFLIFGWTEWDLVRGSFLIALFAWWLRRTFRPKKMV